MIFKQKNFYYYFYINLKDIKMLFSIKSISIKNILLIHYSNN